jgi:LysR family tcuABC transcriptional regulator
MHEISLRQIRAVIAVCEESSFTRAAERELATQSGISQRIAALEKTLGVKLFDRSVEGVRPTAAGRQYYQRCVEAVGAIRIAADEIVRPEGALSGPLRIGITAAFARVALAPALKRFVCDYPEVRIKVFEGYSSTLVEKVASEQLDFAVVPNFEQRLGVSCRPLVTDREVLVSARSRGLSNSPVRLRDIRPLRLVLPGASNVHQGNVESYCRTNNIQVDELIEMEGMVGTLEFIAESDWMCILPSLMIPNLERLNLVASPITDPSLHSDFMIAEPSRCPLTHRARLFLGQFEAELKLASNNYVSAPCPKLRAHADAADAQMRDV